MDTRLRIKPSLARPKLEIQRPLPSTPSPSAELEADRVLREQGVALLQRADQEMPALLSEFARDHGLPTAPQHTRSADFSAPGSTFSLGFDFLGEPINAHGVSHIVYSGTGQGSFARMTEPSQALIFTIMWRSMPAGIYLAVVHASGSAQKLSVSATVYPSGQFQVTAERTGSKFLVPFEMSSAGGLSLSLRMGDPGDLTLYRVDVTRVS
ncbi:MAG: hypothetical protein JNL82_21640 [Myxococcales bacterium]|nr:hypothetical protein [Myxococcales bacterium]